jgi:hypothetical protein
VMLGLFAPTIAVALLYDVTMMIAHRFGTVASSSYTIVGPLTWPLK